MMKLRRVNSQFRSPWQVLRFHDTGFQSSAQAHGVSPRGGGDCGYTRIPEGSVRTVREFVSNFP